MEKQAFGQKNRQKRHFFGFLPLDLNLTGMDLKSAGMKWNIFFVTSAQMPSASTNGDSFINDFRLSASYYDSETTGQSDDDGRSTPQTTAGLQGPTGYTGIYVDWNVNDPWHFGTASQYPVLKADFNGDGSTSDDVVRQRQ